jgi:hypothetical protein
MPACGHNPIALVLRRFWGRGDGLETNVQPSAKAADPPRAALHLRKLLREITDSLRAFLREFFSLM